MTEEGRPVVGRAERVAVARTWRAVPVRTRWAVLRAADRGERHPDEAAVAAAVDWARVAASPSGTHWYQRSNLRLLGWLLVGVGAFVAVTSVLELLLLGADDPVSWSGVAFGAVAVVVGLLYVDLHRGTQRLLALDAPGKAGHQGGSSGQAPGGPSRRSGGTP